MTATVTAPQPSSDDDRHGPTHVIDGVRYYLKPDFALGDWSRCIRQQEGEFVDQVAFARDHRVRAVRLFAETPLASPRTLYALPPGRLAVIPGFVAAVSSWRYVADFETAQQLYRLSAGPEAHKLAEGLAAMPKMTVRDVRSFSGPGAGAELAKRPPRERVGHLLGVVRSGRLSEANMQLAFAQAAELRRQIEAERAELDAAEGMLEMVGAALTR